MFVLDTDHFTLLGHAESAEGQRIGQRLAKLEMDEWGTTIITYEEQMRGWLKYIKTASKSRSIAPQVEAYRRLFRHLDVYRNIIVLATTGLAQPGDPRTFGGTFNVKF